MSINGTNVVRKPNRELRIKERFDERVAVSGWVRKEEYASWLHRSDILPVTSMQDLFGISIMEEVYCNCYPLLPERPAYPEL